MVWGSTNRGVLVVPKSLFCLSLVIALGLPAAPALEAQAPVEEVAMAETAVDERPALVPGSCQAPVYPVLLRSARVEGRVVLQYIVNTDGRVDPASITTLQSPHRQFDDAARRALATCRYRPGRAESRPVRVMVQTPFTFALAASR